MSQPLRKLRDYAEQHGCALLGILLAIILLIAGSLIVWKVPHWQVQRAIDAANLEKAGKHAPTSIGNPEPTSKSIPFVDDYAKQLELEDNFRKTIVQMLGGAFLLLGLYYSARTFGLSREGHITDRFTKAIEQLGWVVKGEPSIEVRLGAIYALERIAIDSLRDHWTIMEILTAYVRENTSKDHYVEGEKPRTDIQAILTVLGRRKTGPKREREGLYLDLAKSSLSGVKLKQPNLQRTSLVEANLQGAVLLQANLQHASLYKANLQNAELIAANLQGAILEGANLQSANLDAADLQDTDLRNANLQDVMWLQIDQIKSARNWEQALYSPDLRQQLGLPPVDEQTQRTSHTDPSEL